MFQKIEQTDDNVYKINYKVSVSDRTNIYLMSDIHYDSIKCDRELFHEHLDECINDGSGLLINGDFFDVMQGRNDRRGSSKAIRKEYYEEMSEYGMEYYDVVPRISAKELAPKFKKLPFIVIGYGNHETSISKHQETDILANFVYELRKEGVKIYKTGYSGFLLLNFNLKNTTRTSNSYRIAHHHGNWGGLVTKGMLGVPRRHLMFSNADMVVGGHVHDQVTTSTTSNEVTSHGKIIQKTKWGLVIPSYKNGFGKGFAGFETEKHTPKPLGCYRVEIKLSRNIYVIATPIPLIKQG